MRFGSVADVEQALRAESYLPDRGLATAVFLAASMGRPLLLEGEAGVGKTEVGKTLARILDADLIRLQCYEGIDASQALYEWDYARQLLYARALQEGEVAVDDRVAELYGPEFLLERPLLRAIRAGLGRGAPRRRARPRRRRVRGLPARGALGLHRHGARAGDDRGRRSRRPSSSRRTARASSTTRSSAAASTTGSTSPTSRARRRSSGCALPASRRRWRARSRDGLPPARARPGQAPGRRGGDRLGAGSLPPGRDVGRRRRRPARRWARR